MKIARKVNIQPDLPELRKQLEEYLLELKEIEINLSNTPPLLTIGEMKNLHDVEIAAELRSREEYFSF